MAEQPKKELPRKTGFAAFPWWVRWTVYLSTLAAIALTALLGAWQWALTKYEPEVPDVSWAESYRPPIISNAISGDDQLLAEFFRERRHVVQYRTIPKKMVQAFIAAEDDSFFDHPGFDWKGIARASIQNVVAGRRKSGASTLTQQTAKAMLISHWGFEKATEKSFKRKICELILARRLEQRLTKEQIIWLYLNQVYLGHNSYGVQAAAENYFRKNVWDLSLGETALLAGLPQSPTRYSPFRHADRARERRKYVLKQMLEKRMISREEHDDAQAEKVEVMPVDDVFHETAPYVAEHVRRDVVARYSNERLLNDGLQIYTTVDLEMERSATEATLKGLGEAEELEGYRGPLDRLEPAEEQTMTERIIEVRELQRASGEAPDSEDELDTTRPYVGVVLEVRGGQATIGIGDKIEGTVSLKPWAAHIERDLKPRRTIAGDLVLVQPHRAPRGAVTYSLEQDINLQSALISLDPRSGYVLAMIGGYDFNRSEFNRAFQSCRQPGSAFKPVFYSAALDGRIKMPKRGGDEECHNRDGKWSGGAWESKEKRCSFTQLTNMYTSNVEYGGGKPKSHGGAVMNLRDALAHSDNNAAVQIFNAVGATEVSSWAHHLGITTWMDEVPSLALGSSCVHLWDLTRVYAVFNQLGKRRQSTFIRRIEDRDGRTLEDHSAYYDPWATIETRLAAGYAELYRNDEQLMDPTSAHITTELMQAVTQYGTARQAGAVMGRPVAGKTGTTNSSVDAWFMGYTPELVTGVWVGYDDNSPMSGAQQGARTALPIWIRFMKEALEGRPVRQFTVPGGITQVSGVAFRIGTESGVPDPPEVDVEDEIMEDEEF